jgi:hypothetical protein
LRASLSGKRGEILLPGFERIHFCSSGAFRIHCEPDGPDHDADDAGRDILSDLGVVLVGEFFSLEIVRLDLRANHGAIALRVLRLHNGDGVRVAPGAGA